MQRHKNRNGTVHTNTERSFAADSASSINDEGGGEVRIGKGGAAESKAEEEKEERRKGEGPAPV